MSGNTQPMTPDVGDGPCSCCGIPTDQYSPLDTCGKCALCHLCRGVHGDAFELDVIAAISHRLVPMWQGLAAMIADDAHHTGQLRIYSEQCRCGKPGCKMPRLEVARAPKRWEVVLARALARCTMPDLETLIGAALLPYLGKPNLPHVREAVALDIRDALCAVDSDIVSIEVAAEPSIVNLDEINISVLKRTSDMPGEINTAPDVAIPYDIHTRPRGQA